jgi:hypothetical protein
MYTLTSIITKTTIIQNYESQLKIHPENNHNDPNLDKRSFKYLSAKVFAECQQKGKGGKCWQTDERKRTLWRILSGGEILNDSQETLCHDSDEEANMFEWDVSGNLI